eukprot:scpid94922/ scgid4024/ Dual specificity mitogen-activated protein kinase kinase 2; ERK activator kinase 2; MAPK/ERK kinase 2
MFYGAMQYKGGAALFFERLCNWTLTVIKENSPGRVIPEYALRPIAAQVLRALAYLEESKVVHNNLNGSNILVQESGVVKLIGFGMAWDLSGSEAFYLGVGSYGETRHHINPPELQDDARVRVTYVVDTWHLGVLLFMLATGSQPITSNNASRPGSPHAGETHRDYLRAVEDGSALLWNEAYMDLSFVNRALWSLWSTTP